MPQWHHKVHQRWARERLHFWRMGFFPTYRVNEVKQGIRTAMAEGNVHSATAYELIGVHDVLLRVWLPAATSADEFQDALIRNVGPADLRMCEWFAVNRFVRNWVWKEKDGAGIVDPEEEALAARPSDHVLARAEDRMEPEYSKLEGADLIRDPGYHRDGIKFFLVVTASPANASLAMTRRLEQRLTRILDDAPSSIRERSLYVGQGFGQFILMGNVEFGEYYDIGECLTNVINDSELHEEFLNRTYTHLGSVSEPLIRQESLPKDAASARTPVQELLLREESTELEVKGSAFLNYDRLLNQGTLSWDDRGPIESVIKTIVAFLNAHGGVLVIGALESARYGNAATLEKLEELGAFELVGDYVVPGVSVDYRTEKERWDTYQRRLQDIIRNRIRPDAMAFISIDKDKVDNLDMCVISVTDLTGSAQGLFYAVEDGSEIPYVREGSENKRKKPSEAAQYLRSRG